MISPHGPIDTGEIADAVTIGVAAGYKIARGTAKLDGANPTPVLHGLTTVIAHMANPRGTVAPNDPVQVTTDVSGTTLNLYGWKHTSAATTTLVASANTTVDIDWVAIGT